MIIRNLIEKRPRAVCSLLVAILQLGPLPLAGAAPSGKNPAESESPKSQLGVRPGSLSEGLTVGWGFNDEGQVGDGTRSDRNVAVITDGLGRVTAVSAGSRFSVALKANGTVWAWGYDYTGQLGDGQSFPSSKPQLVAGLTDVSAVSAGNSHVLALKRDGTVWAWGFGKYGQIGHGSVGDPASKSLDDTLYAFGRPVQVFGLHDIIAISAGAFHSLALDSSGSVWAWGNNDHGELGEALGERVAYPARIKGLERVVEISAGYWHNLVRSADGSVYGWGCNYSGQLGIPPQSLPISRVPLRIPHLDHMSAIAAGRAHNISIDESGRVWTWGLNEFDVLANGTAPEALNPTPERVAGLDNVVSVAAGYNHSVALKADGTIWSWGSDEYDSLGNGADVPPGRMRRILAGETPTYDSDSIARIPRASVPGLVINGRGVRAISASSSGWHTLAITMSP